VRDKPNRGPCQVDGCPQDAWARGWCNLHYLRWHKHGDPLAVIERWAPAETRFWANVSKGAEGECWLWTGSKAGGTGYGQIYADGRAQLAHRFAYELLVGSIPGGLVIDHVKERGCTSRACVNPAHMEPVTHRENILRGNGYSARAARVTHCPQGHPYDADNTATVRGWRRCKTCHRDRARHRRKATA
jgi:hypothetical protein